MKPTLTDFPPISSWTLLENAEIITLDPSHPSAHSLLMAGNRIVALFDEPHPGLTLPAGTVRCYNLRGRTVVPGFTDSHMHLLEWGIALGRAELSAARSAPEVVALATAHVRQNPVAPGGWIVGQGWAFNQWHDPTLPTSTAMLDEAFPDNPVILYSKCLHLAWANAAALRAAAIDADTPAPPGGEIARDPQTRRPTGILKEDAIYLVDRIIPPLDDAARRKALERAIATAHAFGIVAVHNMEPVETFRILQQANTENALRLRVTFYLPGAVLDDAVRAGIRARLGDERLRVAGVKLFVDGSLGGRTAWMFEPLENEPDNVGIPILHGRELRGVVGKANANGLSCAIHAIGDRAVADALGAYEEAWNALAGSPVRDGLRNRIEHFQTIRPEELAVLGRVPVAACMQSSHLFFDWEAADRWLGKRARWTYPLRSLREAGALLALGSDAPVTDVNVLQGMYAAAHRRDLDGRPAGGWYPEECITRAEALEAYCLAGPRISRDEGDRGALSPGKRADLAVLDVNPLTASAEALRDGRALATLFDGQWVHGADWAAEGTGSIQQR